MKNLLFIMTILLFVGCKEQCACNNPNCGPKCRLQCQDNRCTPGERCCDKCICNPTEK